MERVPSPGARRAGDLDAELPVEVSVIVPVRNAAGFLGQQLHALAEQEYPGRWEVIVADNGSEDDSRALAETFADALELKVVDAAEHEGAAYARNAGAAAASATKLLFVDADDEVAPGYVAAMSAALDHSGLVAARLDHVTLNPPWVREAYGTPWQETDVELAFGFLPATASCALGVRRDLFEEVGGFNESFRAASAEDVAFCWDVQLRGTPLQFVPDAVLRFRYRQGLAELFRQTRVQGAALPLLFRLYRERGMRRRIAIDAWPRVLLRLARARRREDLARAAAELGFRVGRLEGSIRHRVIYL